MKMMMFGFRTTKEIIRDPLSVFFGLAFPIILLLLLTFINQNIPNDLFHISSLAPGIVVFGLSFMTLFSAQMIAKDRVSELLARLFTTPMKAYDFILGYTLPLIPMSLVQAMICYGVSIMLGMDFTLNVLLAIITVLPVAILFIGIGLLCGSIFNEKAVAGICGALLTNLTAWLSGIWFSLELVGGWFEKIAYALPFVHAVDMGKAVFSGDYANIFPHIWWVVGYGLVITVLAIYIFQWKMKNR
ncbi:ABC transporter permease [Oceanobacillus profundus]|uniref:ABC transporter permease n=1 Tax=Oceanobacillus TaxID=182709 RepID=UPI0026E38F5C|nr:ABC transporter permease [Oceanobacillus profundus]MBR3120083.1 ABC transporter permease [Oceanobacillus sp.]MDO6451000.1 ABC transporter permease [Oceanobacillus profundus]